MSKNYAKFCNWGNLYEAYLAAREGKTEKNEIMYFEQNLLVNLALLQEQLENKTYRVGEYRVFVITEPKKRVIMALPFADRIVQHALCDQVTRPILEKQFISANAANRDGRGTHFGIELFARKMTTLWHKNPGKKNNYCLKGDISGFFYNIDREIMKEKLAKIFKDEDICEMHNMLIDSSPDLTHNGQMKYGKGLPIGNLTSQFFAIYYLSAFDHFVKEVLGIKHYVRYMDDFTILHSDKEFLRNCMGEIYLFLQMKDKLELNWKKTQIFPLSKGVDFLGWHFYYSETGKIIMKLRKDSKKRMIRKMKFLYQAFLRGQMSFKEIHNQVASWIGHVKYGNTYALRKMIMCKYDFSPHLYGSVICVDKISK